MLLLCDSDDSHPTHRSHAMILTLSEKDYLNTLLKDESGRALYQINTPSTIFGGRTTITRLIGQMDHEIAWIAWNSFTPDEFHQHGRTVEASERFPRKGFFRTRRVLLASDGQSYVWKDGRGGVKVNRTAAPPCPAAHPSSESIQLDRADAEHSRVAKYHTRSLGFFSKSHPAYLEVAADGVPILDDIVASFVYVEKKRQQHKD
ncbi:hypothetical protein EWM64_g8324 [Hericium alpestre]|uniref:DUF6593 domain-containing protein n=1 Tax=Hericium alpestre TaxID=135208 RepID=A0A4Y9ZQG2_9AGAM|nr:hypothetical protein EWM64_g8324 [Hericium alpestre]